MSPSDGSTVASVQFTVKIHTKFIIFDIFLDYLFLKRLKKEYCYNIPQLCCAVPMCTNITEGNTVHKGDKSRLKQWLVAIHWHKLTRFCIFWMNLTFMQVKEIRIYINNVKIRYTVFESALLSFLLAILSYFRVRG